MSRPGAAALPFVLLAAAACGGGATGSTASTLPIYLQLADVDGAPLRLRDLRGQPVVLHLFTVGSMAA